MLNDMANYIHKQNVDAGWWDRDKFPEKIDRLYTALMLTVAEIAEATEGVRKSLPDDKLPHFKMRDVELADTQIRLLDLAGAFDVDLDIERFALEIEIATDDINEFYSANDIERLFYLCRVVCMPDMDPTKIIRQSVATVCALAAIWEIDLHPIIREKMAFNATRADHQRANRAKPGGKEF